MLDSLTKGGFDQSTLTTKGLSRPVPTPNPPNAAEKVVLISDPHQLSVVRTALQMDPGKVDPLGLRSAYQSTDESLCTYSGSDMQVLLEIPGSNQSAKVLIELVTLSVSVHREKAPVRALGYINPKAFARGRRTIGGTIILTEFNVDFLYRFLGMKVLDVSKDTLTPKIDQLPPFNLTLLFSDEYGHASQRHLLGCDILTDGTVYSSNDMMSERSITYMASDFTPLLPVGVVGQADASVDRGAMGNQKTPKSAAMAKKGALGNTAATPSFNPVHP